MRRHPWLLPAALVATAFPSAASAATIGPPSTLLDAGRYETVLEPTVIPGPGGFDVLGIQWGIQGSRPVVATKLDAAGTRAPGTVVGTSGSQGPAARLTYVAAARLASGDVLAVWVDDQERLVARPLSGDVEEVVDGEGPTLDPHVATDPNGNALMTWRTGKPYTPNLVAAVRLADGRYQDRIELDRDARRSAVAMDASGAGIVAWATDRSGRFRLRTRAADGTWSPTADLGSISGDDAFALDIDPATGRGWVAWLNDDHRVLAQPVDTRSGAAGAAVRLGRGLPPTLALGVDGRGAATVALAASPRLEDELHVVRVDAKGRRRKLFTASARAQPPPASLDVAASGRWLLAARQYRLTLVVGGPRRSSRVLRRKLRRRPSSATGNDAPGVVVAEGRGLVAYPAEGALVGVSVKLP